MKLFEGLVSFKRLRPEDKERIESCTLKGNNGDEEEDEEEKRRKKRALCDEIKGKPPTDSRKCEIQETLRSDGESGLRN